MWKIYQGDAKEKMKEIESQTVQCVVTSPPYWGLRDYGEKDQLGLEKTPEEYVGKMVEIFREVRRVLRDDGTVWLNLGDSYAQSGGSGSEEYQKRHKQFGKIIDSGTKQNSRNAPKGYKPKDLIGIPWLVAFALRADGWYLRQDIIWAKPNPMPESVTDRCTKAHEYIFLLTKSAKYYYDAEAVKEPTSINSHKKRKDGGLSPYELNAYSKENLPGGIGKYNPTQNTKRNKHSVWTVSTQPYPGAHFATFPPKLIEPCILAGSKPGDVILDPFAGSGTTSYVAEDNGRDSIAIDLSKKYCKQIEARMKRIYPRLLHDRGVIS